MAYYSGTEQNMKRILRAVKVGDDRLSSITSEDLAFYQSEADSLINIMLSGTYYTPLVEITVDGVTGYPDPIPHVARLQTAIIVLESIYTETEPNSAPIVEKYKQEIKSVVDRIIKGSYCGTYVLRGQRLLAKTRFTNPYVSPKENPTD